MVKNYIIKIWSLVVFSLAWIGNASESYGQVRAVGPLTGSVVANDASISGGVWAGLNNLQSVDGLVSSASALFIGGTSEYLTISNFGFSVPSNATIEGVEITMRVKSSGLFGTSVTDNSIKLIKRGAIQGEDGASDFSWPTSFVNHTVGGSSDMWGSSFRPADVNASKLWCGYFRQLFGFVCSYCKH